jgi:hypothetical protein
MLTVSKIEILISQRSVITSGSICHYLQASNPVSMGKTRARQQSLEQGGYRQIHSDGWNNKVLNLQVSLLNST